MSEATMRRSQLGNATRWISPRFQDPESAKTVEMTSSGNTLLVAAEAGLEIIVTALEVGNGDDVDDVVYVREGTTGDALHKVNLRAGSVVSRNLLGSELRLSAGAALYGNRGNGTGTVYVTVCFYRQ